MSANIDTMLYVGETPWHGLGVKYDEPPKTSEEIINGASLGWEVGAEPMKTDLHDKIYGYHAIYRKDNNEVLGVVNNGHPQIVQNRDTFNTFNRMIGSDLEVETAASLGRGETVFGCFKINGGFKVIDDDVDHYFVVLNDHLRPDGKITVLNTPVRVVCQNTLSAALSNSAYKLRIPITDDFSVNESMAIKLKESVGTAIDSLNRRAEKMLKMKITRSEIDTILDELFPYMTGSDGTMLDTAANMNQSVVRDTFTQCLAVDNLANYRGTAWQIMNALTDFTQHYYKKIEKSFDLNYRMKKLPGVGQPTETDLVAKYLKMADKLVA